MANKACEVGLPLTVGTSKVVNEYEVGEQRRHRQSKESAGDTEAYSGETGGTAQREKQAVFPRKAPDCQKPVMLVQRR